MGNDFKNYMRNNRSKPKISDADLKKVKQNFSDSEIKNVENITKQYENMSEGELMGEISRMAAAQKKNGSLSNAEIDHFTNNIMPMLDAEQKRKLSGIINMLKK